MALLVGIEDYDAPRTPALLPTEAWPRLRGPGNDLRSMSDLLRKQGFEVKCLFDAQATKANIVKAWRAHLVKGVRAKKGDVALFYFSGHGQQVTDDKADKDEADGYDEALVPYDHRGAVDPSGHLRDDDLHALAKEVEAKTDNLVVIVDSCHSGTVTRGWLAARGASPRTPPAKWATTPKEDISDGFELDRSVVLAAARSEQVAREYQEGAGGRVFGAFTYLLVDALNAAAASGRATRVTYKEIMREVSVRLPGLGTLQEPWIKGDRDRVVFSGALRRGPDAFAVEPLESEGGTVVRGGRLHGLVEGTWLALFPQGTELGRLTAKALAAAPRVRVEGVKVASASVVPVDLAGKPVGKEARAVLSKRFARGALAIVTRQPRPARLRVKVDVMRDAVEAATRASLGGGQGVVFVDGVEGWDLHVRRASPKRSACDDAGPKVEMVTAGGEPVRFSLGRERTAKAWVSLSAKNLVPLIAQGIRGYEAMKRLVDLSTETGDRGLAVSLMVRVTGEREVGGRCERQGSAATGQTTADRVTLPPARCFELVVRNDERHPVFVEALVVDPDLSIQLLPTTSDAAVPPGETRAIGKYYTQLPSGLSSFKLIATTLPIDPSMLTFTPEKLTGVRGGGEKAKGQAVAPRLTQYLDTRLGATRSSRVAPFDRWGTAAVEILVRGR